MDPNIAKGDHDEAQDRTAKLLCRSCSVPLNKMSEQLFLHHSNQMILNGTRISLVDSSSQVLSEQTKPASSSGKNFLFNSYKSKIINAHSKVSTPKKKSTKKPLKCFLCEYNTDHYSYLETHISAVHLKKKPFRCQECEFCTAYQPCLSAHMKKIHLKEKPFECGVCDCSYVSKHELAIHVKAVHLKEKPFKCSECDYSSAYRNHAYSHYRVVHLREKPFKCSVCKFRAPYKSKLLAHLKAVHLKHKPLKCRRV